MESWQDQLLVGGGDTFLHYHLADRGPFPIPHGSFYDTTTQTIAVANTAYSMSYNTTVLSNLTRVSSTKVYVETSGVYNIQFSCQLENSDSTDHDVDIWLSVNGTNSAETNTKIAVPSKHGGVNGHAVAAWNFFERMNRNDYFELKWSAASTQVSMPHFAAASSPTRPSTPSVILTVQLVSI